MGKHSPRGGLPRSVLLPPMLQRTAKLKFVLSSSARPSQRQPPMPRCRLVLLSHVPRSSARCSSVLEMLSKMLRQSVRELPQLLRLLLPKPAVLRRLLSRLVVPRTVPTASASLWRPRLTELHPSTRHSVHEEDTSWTDFSQLNLSPHLVLNCRKCMIG